MRVRLMVVPLPRHPSARAQREGVWGPFLVVAPSSTLHNWEAEISKFCPEFKVLPYWGSVRERKTLRRGFSHRLGSRESNFHIVISSYKLACDDLSQLNRVRVWSSSFFLCMFCMSI